MGMLGKWEMKDCFEAVRLNKYGFYELRKMNTAEERKEIFEKEYFQEYNGATYSKQYSEEELEYLYKKYAEMEYVIRENLEKTGGFHEGKYSLLDIGCGEGFFLKYFREKGVRVKGFDFGSYALMSQNPEMEDVFMQGNMDDILPQLAQNGEKFDVVNMARVLEMSLDIEETMQRIKPLLTDEGILFIKSPNNYSPLQQMLLESGELSKEYWLDAPDHTYYFNREGLISFCDAQGYECVDFYADYFIDLNLLNPLTNYYENPECGKQCRKATVRLESLLHSISLEKTIEIYRRLGDMGFGREFCGVFRVKKGDR